MTTLHCPGWMQNQNDQNPCTVAQEIGQLCTSGYAVPLTNFSESNYVPNATTANGCTCSWSIYNLLSACSYCVGQTQYTSWVTWVVDCGNYASNTSYLPTGLQLSQGIPYWAATNPSTWENAVFNTTQAAATAAADHPDVTGGPLPTTTASTIASPGSHISVGIIVASVIGAIAIIVIGGLTILFVMRRRRRRNTHSASAGDPSFSASQPATVPAPLAPLSPSGYYTHVSSASRTTSPVRSTASGALTSPLTSFISSHFSSLGHSTVQPLSDAADMISPFLATSSSQQTNRSNTSAPTGKAAEALAQRVRIAPDQRTRLNPPPYSASVDPPSGSSVTTTKREKKSAASAGTRHSGHSRTSTKESVASAQTEQSRLSAATSGVEHMRTDGAGGGAGGAVTMVHGGRAGQRPPAI